MQSRIYCFDRYIIDPTRREFRDGDKRISLQLLVFDVIVYLLEHRDRAVCRDELISAVWGRVDVSNNELNVIIGRARRALGDSGEKQHTIRTIPRFGYGWVRKVEEGKVDLTHSGHASEISVERKEAETTPRGESESRSMPFPAPWRKTARWISPLLAVLAVAATAAFWPGPAEENPVVPAREQTALVLPVTVVGEKNESWIRLGVMDLIAERLRAAGQSVVPSENVIALAGEFRDFTEIDSDVSQRLAQTAAASIVLAVQAETVAGQWRLSLRVVHGGGPEFATYGQAADVLTAAHTAADHMARVLGHSPAINTGPAEDNGDFTELHQQIRAAQLADEHEQVRRLFANAPESLRAHPEIRYLVAVADLRARRLLEARAAFEELRQVVPVTDNQVLHGKIYNGIAYSHFRQRNYETADQYFTRSLELLKELPGYEARKALGSLYNGRGASRAQAGQYDLAMQDFSRGRIILESIGDQMALGSLENNFGVLHYHIARTTEALTSFTGAARIAREFHLPQLESRARFNAASAHLRLLDPAAALQELDRVRGLTKQISNPQLKQMIGLQQADILLENGQLSTAKGILIDLFAGFEDAESSLLLATFGRLVDASVAWRAGRPKEASQKAMLALESNWDRGTVTEQSEARRLLMRAQIKLDDFEAAGETLAAAMEWLAANDEPQVRLVINLMQAEYAAALDDREAVDQYFSQALALAERRAVPFELLQVARPYAEWLIEQGELDSASVIAGRVTGWADRSYNAALLQLRLYHALGDVTAWRYAHDRASALAGEREIPPELLVMPNGASNSASLAAHD